MWALLPSSSARVLAVDVDDGSEARTNARPAIASEASHAATLPPPGSKTPNSNYWKGCSWSPDGTCILAARDDQIVRVYQLAPGLAEAALDALEADDPPPDAPHAVPRPHQPAPQRLETTATASSGEVLYDMKWYPGFNYPDGATMCFATTSRGQPVHLWNAFDGRTRATYRYFDHMDEIAAACCLRFHPDGARLFGGVKDGIVAWQLGRPGRDYEVIRTRTADGGQKGLISSLDVALQGDLLAAGSFNGSVGVYSLASMETTACLRGHRGGVTHVQFSRCGNFLYTGARKDSSLFCWDVRNTGEALYEMHGDAWDTNQRLQFDIEPCGRHLLHGDTCGGVDIFDLCTGEKAGRFQVAVDCVSAVALHPVLPMLVACSGHRRFTDVEQEFSDADGGVVGVGGLSNALVVAGLDADASWSVPDDGDIGT